MRVVLVLFYQFIDMTAAWNRIWWQRWLWWRWRRMVARSCQVSAPWFAKAPGLPCFHVSPHLVFHADRVRRAACCHGSVGVCWCVGVLPYVHTSERFVSVIEDLDSSRAPLES